MKYLVNSWSHFLPTLGLLGLGVWRLSQGDPDHAWTALMAAVGVGHIAGKTIPEKQRKALAEAGDSGST